MRAIFILFFFIAGITPSLGQDIAGGSHALTLEDCIQLALKNRIEM